MEVTEKIKLIVQEEIDKFYVAKNKHDVSEEITVLNQKLEKERERCAHYRHKLHAKKDYVSPQTVQSEIDKVKAQLILEFNRYSADYAAKPENKDKKLSHFDLGKIFDSFINLNVTFTNPKEVNFDPSLIRGEAKASVVGAGVAV